MCLPPRPGHKATPILQADIQRVLTCCNHNGIMSCATTTSVHRCGALLVALAAALYAFSAAAQEQVWVGSVQLRGGFDSNPTLVAGRGDGSAFAGIDAAMAGGGSTEALTIGVIGEIAATKYGDSSVAASMHQRASVTVANNDRQDWAVTSTTILQNLRSYEERAFAAIQSLRLQWMRGTFRPFVTTEAAYSTLNETNAIFADFLPQPHRTLRGTIIPGLAIRIGELEAGTSLNLSAIRYAEELDDFLFRRDNERIEPFLFASYEWNKLSLFASISRLFGDWHDPDLGDVAETLYDLSLTWRGEPVEVTISASRTAKETTFPVSPLATDRILSASIRWAIAADTIIGAYGSRKVTDYLGSPFRSRTVTFGGLLEHRISTGLTLGFELGRSRAIPFAGESADAILAFASIKRSFGDAGGGPKPAPH